MMIHLKRFLDALQFLTIVRIPQHQQSGPNELIKSIEYFPVVGLFIGICLACLNYFLNLFLPSSIVLLALIVFLTIITGGLHVDGFADTVDAIASGKKGEDALKIMRQSTIGPIAAFFIFIILLAKYVGLGEFVGGRLYSILLLFPIIGRMAMVSACFMFPYARPEGTGKIFINSLNMKQFVISGTIGFISGFLLFGIRGLFIAALTILIAMLFGKYCTERIGGITGDTLGFINEISEVVAIIGCCVIL